MTWQRRFPLFQALLLALMLLILSACSQNSSAPSTPTAPTKPPATAAPATPTPTPAPAPATPAPTTPAPTTATAAPAPTASAPAPTTASPAPATPPATADTGDTDQKVTVLVHYWRPDAAYDGVSVLSTGETGAKSYKFWTKNDFGIQFEYAIYKNLATVPFTIQKDGKDLEQPGEITVTKGVGEIWVASGKGVATSQDEAMKLKPAKKERPPLVLPKPGIVVHYRRTDGNYKGWDLWAWELNKSGAAAVFNEKDDYGVKTTVLFDEIPEKYGFLVRCCDGGWGAKDFADDRFAVPDKNGAAEVWLRSGTGTVFTDPDEAMAAAATDVAPPPAPKLAYTKTTATVHYFRPDGNYKDWDLYAWGDEFSATPFPFQTVDADGAKAVINIDKPVTKISFIVRKGGDKWEAKDPDGDRSFAINADGTAEIWLTSGSPDIKTKPAVTATNVTVHYTRPDGNYQDWDLWVWADGVDGKAYPFNGTDNYGAVSTFTLPKVVSGISFIVRKGGDKWEAKDPDGDRTAVVKDGTAEIWLTSGKPDVVTDYQPADTEVKVHYNRPDGNYKDWDLWVWADGVDGKAYAFTGSDAYGAVADVKLPKAVAKASFIVRKGGDKWEAKDPDGDRSADVKHGYSEIWLASGKSDVYYQKPINDTQVNIHYYRPDGNYKDWDLWVWADGVDGKAYPFTSYDGYGAVASFKLDKPVAKVSFIVRKGGDKWEAKDPDGDRSANVKDGATEVWLTSGQADVAYKAPEYTTVVKIHYHRDDGNYKDWDLWVWGPGLDGQAIPFTDTGDGYGATAVITTNKPVTSLSFIVRKGGDKWEAKDPDGDRSIAVKNRTTVIWLLSGKPDVYTEQPATK